MRYKILLLMGIISLFFQCKSEAQNTRAQTDNADKWVWLFDGSSTDAWQEVGKNTFPEEGWEIRNNELVVLEGEGHGHGGKDIVTKNQYANFDLQLEFMLEEGGNSGIKYFVVDNFPGHEGTFLGLEYQLIDDEGHPDAQKGVAGNRTVASLYDLIPAPTSKVVNPPNQWNKVRILVDDEHVEHWLNGKKMFEYERNSPEFRALVSKSKYKGLADFGEAPKGHILLQGHGDTVSFRNIKIKAW